ncbi:coiled-coil domain-containing protein 171 isoform X2 [Esox lucius]|uniref:coiled-coil domain-containing protein 171 isoform X2 n=1 Tax=Esox lucius TaxID=8010 RepID=UPI001477018A|nr:coiled-coil domain-containing protein 171 isoform X2 [Esox lucius]
MPTEGPEAVCSERLRHHERSRRKESNGQSKPILRASHPRTVATASRSSEDEISRCGGILPSISRLSKRLKEVICALQADRQQQRPRGEEGDGPGILGMEELRWRINQLERDKLELASKHNHQVSSLESQVARLRASVERGEAQRQTLEYDMAVVRKEAGLERRDAQEQMAALSMQNQQLMVHTAELQQKVCDLQKALDITRKAREEDQHALQQEVEERDRLVLSTNAENDQLVSKNTQLHKLLQEQEETLQELKKRMGEVQREKERDGEALRRQTSELGCITDREDRIKKELEAALQRGRSLEANIESERAAHLESKFNSEIIQLRIRDLEAALQVEKSSQAEALSSLEMVKQQFREVEKAYSTERAQGQEATQRLAQFEKEHLISEAELCRAVEEEKRVTSQLRLQLQEQNARHTDSQTQLDTARQRVGFLEEVCDSWKRELQQILDHHNIGEPQSSDVPVCEGEEEKHNLTAVMDLLRRTLTSYRTNLDRTTAEVQDQQQQTNRLVQEFQFNQNLLSEQKKHVKECRSALSDCNVELQRLRAECSQKTFQTERLQTDFQTALKNWEREREGEREKERERTAELHEEIQKISQLYQKDSQEKLSFLHGLYQRLLAGCVLISQPQCILGSFTWTELCDVITEHINALTSDLTHANEKVVQLESVCDSKSVCVSELKQSQECVLVRLEETVRQKEEAWMAQRREMEQQHKHAVSQLQGKIQVTHAVSQLQGKIQVTHAVSQLQGKIQVTHAVSQLQGKIQVTHAVSQLQGKIQVTHAVSQLQGKIQVTHAVSQLQGKIQVTHAVSQLQGKIQVYCSQLEEVHQRLSSLERQCSQLTSDLSKIKRALSQSDLQGSALLSACSLLIGAVTHLSHATHTLRTQKALLTHRLARSEGLETGIRTLVQALGDGEAERNGGGGLRRWRSCVVCVIAVNRLCVLGRKSRVLFRMRCRGYPSLGVSVPVWPPLENGLTAPSKGEEEQKDEGRGGECVRWFRCKGLCSFIVSSMAKIQDVLAHTAPSSEVLLSAAQNSLSGLLEGLLTPPDPPSPSARTLGPLVTRLGQGLNPLTDKQISCKRLVASLQQHFLVFTQRLHSAEVERRSLRVQLANRKRVAKDKRQPAHNDPDIHLVPAERFRSVCEELREALQREQQAQSLLKQQADQLDHLGRRMDTLIQEDREREHTLTQAVQSLSEARKEVRHKEQSLRVLGKHLSGLQQQKKNLEESVHHAENAICMTAKHFSQ